MKLNIVTDDSAAPKGIDSTGVADTNVLAFDAASGKFKPVAVAGGSVTKAAVIATGLAAADIGADAAGAASTEQTRAQAAEALAAQKSANLGDLQSASSARTNLGLGSAATQASGAFDASGAAAAAQAASAQGLTPTAVKTGPYTAAAGDFVPVDVSSGAVTVTLPSAPADKTRIGVKLVKVDGSHANACTIAAGGSDVFNVAAGSTTLTLSALFQGALLQYKASSSIWYVSTADTPTGQPLGAAKLGTDGLVGGAGGSGLTSAVVNGASATGGGQIPFSDGAGGYTWNLQDRGAVTYSTTYNPGDTILYYGERILITTAVTTGAGTNGSGQPFISTTKFLKLTSYGWFFASDYGVKADASTDDWAALQSLLLLVRSLTTNSSNGYTVVLPSGQIMLSKPLILPTQTKLLGQGLYSTVLKIMTGANCDVVQPEQFNSAAQAAILASISGAPTQGNLRNAFRWRIDDLTIHGNSGNQSATDYHHGLNAQTNPLTTVAGSDPDFDPAGLVENVQFRSCTGDGFFANGRSAVRLKDCIAWFCRGNGFTPSFDTQLEACQAGFNGITGFYHNHASNQGAACKSYNNGDGVWWWTSGTTYAAASYAATATGLFYTAAGVVNSTVDPGTDTGNWTAISGVTSPKAWGVGVYADSNASEITMHCDCQQNSASNWLVRSTGGGINLTGTSHQPNFGGGSQQTSGNTATNPNSYAHLTLDNAAGVVATLGVTAPALSGATSAYVLNIINGSVHNDVRLAGDANGTLLSPGSSALAGSTNRVSHNGTNYSATLAGLNDAAISGPTDGQALAWNAGAGKWQNSSAGASAFASGIFGDGSDGAATLDGTATVAWATKVGSVYTMTRNCVCTNLTINNGVTLKRVGYIVFCSGTYTNAGTDQCDGNAGTATTGGPSATTGWFGTTNQGGAGSITGAAGAGQNGGNAVGTAGAGGAGSGNAAGGGGSVNLGASWGYRNPQPMLVGWLQVAAVRGAPGAGGGGGDGVNRGGGGGSGGGVVCTFAKTFVNTGTISAVGGAGFTPATGNCGGGGGGGGGFVIAYTTVAWTQSGTIAVTGGALGNGVGTGANGVAGGSGQSLNVVLS